MRPDALFGVWMCLMTVACTSAPIAPLVNGSTPSPRTGEDVILGSGSVMGNGSVAAAGSGGADAAGVAAAAVGGMGGDVLAGAGTPGAGSGAPAGTGGVAAIAGSSGAAPSAGMPAAGSGGAPSAGAPSAGASGAKCPPECLRAYTCASACGATEFNNGCCPCPAGTIDTVSCPNSMCLQGAAGCVSTATGWCGLPCIGAAPSRDVEMACANLKTPAACSAFRANAFPYGCGWHTPTDPPCLAP